MTAIAILASVPLIAANVSHTERIARDFPMELGGSLWIDNAAGDIEIAGSDGPGVSVSVVKIVVAPDAAALKDGRERTQILMGGDDKARVIRTVIAPTRDPKWKSNVSYVVRVPRAAQVHVKSGACEHLRVAGIASTVTVKAFNGDITLENVTGAVTVDTTNGDIHFIADGRPSAPVQLATINGGIEVQVHGDSNIDWIAESIRGDFRTNFPVRGRFSGMGFRGMVNSTGGPTFTTAALMGNIYLLKRGGRQAEIRSLRAVEQANTQIGPKTPVVTERIQTPLVQGNFIYATTYGNFDIGEVRGSANIQTGAGQVNLGTVIGECTVRSGGGPFDFGDIFGFLNAHTDAGEVMVRSVRRGGDISTSGGTLRVMFSGGPLTLQNGGGDIIVGHAAGSVNADSHSGDLTLTIDPNAKTQRVTAKTGKGNVLLTVGARFGAEVDATVLTSEADSNPIHSDFSGLSIKRDQFNGKTRIRATGRIGAGGEKVELYAEDGEIHIGQHGK